MHPAQQALVDSHGSQCGFCTPGFVMSLACFYENNLAHHKSLHNNVPTIANHETDDKKIEDNIIKVISGNLCRCTGYRPIIDAGKTMLAKDKGNNLREKLASQYDIECEGNQDDLQPAIRDKHKKLFIPNSIESLNKLLVLYPDATLWAGGTDLALNITQRLIEHEIIIQLSNIKALKQWRCESTDTQNSSYKNDTLVLGAGMTYQQMQSVLEQYIPSFANILTRIGSPQIRNMGTLGGNIANSSPIGDLSPILLALDAKVHLRHSGYDDNLDNTVIDDKTNQRSNNTVDELIPLADFFIGYKQTKLQLGSYIVAIHIPLLSENQHLFIRKISKRFEDDISACLLALRVDIDPPSDKILEARIGLGGMAAVPLLANNSQDQLINSCLTIEAFKQAALTLPLDVTPLSDVRASREYRMNVIQRLLIECGKTLVNQCAVAYENVQ